jgi:hypothetical protein
LRMLAMTGWVGPLAFQILEIAFAASRPPEVPELLSIWKEIATAIELVQGSKSRPKRPPHSPESRHAVHC